MIYDVYVLALLATSMRRDDRVTLLNVLVESIPMIDLAAIVGNLSVADQKSLAALLPDWFREEVVILFDEKWGNDNDDNGL